MVVGIATVCVRRRPNANDRLTVSLDQSATPPERGPEVASNGRPGDAAYQFGNCSSGTASQQSSWARGETPNGRGTFEYVEDPRPLGPEPDLGLVDPRTSGTPPPPPMKVSARRAS